jgi:hypothetical protein
MSTVHKDDKAKKEEEKELEKLTETIRNFMKIGSDALFSRLKVSSLSDYELDGLSESGARLAQKYMPLFTQYDAEFTFAGFLIFVILARVQEYSDRKKKEREEETQLSGGEVYNP